MTWPEGERRQSGAAVDLTRRLDEMIALLRAEDGAEDSRFCTWVSSKRRADGTFTMPHVLDLPAMDQFWTLCRDFGLAGEYRDYLGWLPRYAEAPYAWIESASWEELDRFLFAAWRQQRFYEGLWDDAVADGRFRRVLERARAVANLSGAHG